jgi:hypothetical protein
MARVVNDFGEEVETGGKGFRKMFTAAKEKAKGYRNNIKAAAKLNDPPLREFYSRSTFDPAEGKGFTPSTDPGAPKVSNAAPTAQPTLNSRVPMGPEPAYTVRPIVPEAPEIPNATARPQPAVTPLSPEGIPQPQGFRGAIERGKTWLQATGGVARNVGRGMQLAGPIVEAYLMNKDVQNTDNPVLKGARAVEAGSQMLGDASVAAVANRALAGRGKAVQLVGTAAAGAAAHQVPKWIEEGVRSAFGTGPLLPSTRINEEKAAADAAAKAKADALAASVAEQEQHGSGTTNPKEAPPTPFDALKMPTQPGDGYVSSADGTKMMGVRKGFFPDSSGMPTIDQTNAAAKAEMRAMDQRAAETKATEGEAMRRRFEEVDLNTQAMDARQQRDAQRSGTAGLLRPNYLKALEADTLRTQANVETAKNRNVETDRFKQNADALKYTADQGLRGHTYTADQKLKGDVIGAEATLGAAGIKARYDAMMKNVDQKKGNREEVEKWGATRFTKDVLDKDGKKTGNVYDPEAHDAFIRDVKTEAARNPEMLKQFKNAFGQPITDPDELTTTHLDQIHQGYKKRMSITNNFNASADEGDDKIQGMVQGLRIAPVEAMDWYNKNSDPKQNSIKSGDAVWGATVASDPLNKFKVEGYGKNGKIQTRMLKDIIKSPEDAEEMAKMLENSGFREDAKKVRNTFKPR